MRTTASIVALLLVAGCGSGPPPSVTGQGALRVATWNVHDLFDDVDCTAPPGVDDLVLSPAAMEAKLERVARVLARLDADVVLLQEVENLAVLRRLAATGPLDGAGYRAYLVEGRDPRGIDVGALARVPVEVGPSHLDDRRPGGDRLWSLPPLELRVPGTRLALFGAHLVSRRDPGEDERRRDQAARLRELGAARARDGLDVLVLGDLNDLPRSAPLAPLLGSGEFTDLGSGLLDADGWTWSGGGARERIDYVLARRGAAVVPLGLQVVPGSDVAAASDHRPLVVDLWLDATLR